MRRRLLALVFLTGGLLLTGLLWPTAAQAHATLEETRPANEEVLAEAPRTVTLRFDEAVVVVGSGVRVFGPAGKRVDRGRSVVDGETVSLPIQATARGTYTVSWRVLSGDSHNLSGTFLFHVGVKTGAVDVTDSQNPFTSAAGGVGRALAFAAAMVLFGAGVVSLLLGAKETDLPLRRLALTAAGAGVVASAFVLSYQAARATGRVEPSWSTLWDLAWHTRTGRLTVARTGVFAATGLALRLRSHLMRWTTIGGAGLLAGIVSIGGHAWTSDYRVFAIVADVCHQLFVGAWLGGIAALLVAVRAPIDRSRLVARFSALALVAAVGTLATGAVSGWLRVRSIEGLTQTGYGQLLLGKVGVFGVLCLFGWLNRQRYLPAIERALKPFVRSLWRSVAAAVVVLGLTSALVNQPPATVALSRPYETRVLVGNALMQLSVSPARTGLNDIHLYFFSALAGGTFEVDAVELTAQTGDLAPRRLTVTPISSSHQSVYGASLTTPGTWTITATTLSGGAKTVFTAKVPIR